jgi:hypothetical protein
VDVGEWLKSLGLGQYEAAFRENAVTAILLPNLIADDLKDLGITLVGHRRQLLDAIAALCLKAAPDESPAQASSPPVPATNAKHRNRTPPVRQVSCNRKLSTGQTPSSACH